MRRSCRTDNPAPGEYGILYFKGETKGTWVSLPDGSVHVLLDDGRAASGKDMQEAMTDALSLPVPN